MCSSDLFAPEAKLTLGQGAIRVTVETPPSVEVRTRGMKAALCFALG